MRDSVLQQIYDVLATDSPAELWERKIKIERQTGNKLSAIFSDLVRRNEWLENKIDDLEADVNSVRDLRSELRVFLGIQE